MLCMDKVFIQRLFKPLKFNNSVDACLYIALYICTYLFNYKRKQYQQMATAKFMNSAEKNYFRLCAFIAIYSTKDLLKHHSYTHGLLSYLLITVS